MPNQCQRMTPTEAKAWIREFLPARDSRWWSLTFWAGVITFVVTEFAAEMPDQYEHWLLRVAYLLGTLGGKMGWSWAGTPDSTQGPRPFNKPRVEHNDNIPSDASAGGGP